MGSIVTDTNYYCFRAWHWSSLNWLIFIISIKWLILWKYHIRLFMRQNNLEVVDVLLVSVLVFQSCWKYFSAAGSTTSRLIRSDPRNIKQLVLVLNRCFILASGCRLGLRLAISRTRNLWSRCFRSFVSFTFCLMGDKMQDINFAKGVAKYF